jgi:hypothetical protein
MEFRLLGEVQVSAAGRILDVGTPRQQAVLAALAADRARRSQLISLSRTLRWGHQAFPESGVVPHHRFGMATTGISPGG